VNTTAQRNPYWLIVQRDRSCVEVVTTRLGDGRTVLPVFSFEEEAILYARLGTRVGSRARRTSDGELLSMLCGPYRRVDLVALDPWPNAEAEAAIGVISLGRKRFVSLLLRRCHSAKPLPSIAPLPGVACGGGSS
jgi:hypothetical protein